MLYFTDRNQLVKNSVIILLIIILTSCSEENSNSSKDNDIPTIDFELPSLYGFLGFSKEYKKYYSGNWRDSQCNVSGKATIGITGTVAEFSAGRGFMEPVIGEIDASGAITFPPRTMAWGEDCEDCGEVRPLEISGNIKQDQQGVSISFEIACRAIGGHAIYRTQIYLKKGIFQPSPSQELARIKAEVLELTGSRLECREDSDCSLINLSNKNTCNSRAIAYSNVQMTEPEKEQLLALKREYSSNEYLLRGQDGSFTLCAKKDYAYCNVDKCEKSN